MKTLLLTLGIAFIIGMGALWLYAIPQSQTSSTAPEAPGEPAAAISPLAASPTVGIPSATPPTIVVNTPTTVTVIVAITPVPISNGVNLLRIGATGTQPTILGVMHDDGKNGDAVAGDGVYTLQVAFTETTPGQILLQVSAAVQGQLRRLVSSPIIIPASGLLLSTQTQLDPLILIGTVTAISSGFQSSTSSVIVSDVVISPLSAVKGVVPPSPVVVRVLGGTVGNIVQQAVGTGSLEPGQEVLLFLDGPDANGRYTIPEGALGIFHILTDPSLGQIAIVDPSYKMLDLIQPLDPSFQSLLSQSDNHTLTLANLLQAISQH